DGMDIVGVRHIGDIAAYLCGAGSEVACTTLELVSVAYAEPQTTTQQDRSERQEPTLGAFAPVR
ncbi:MAG: hypothetical protein ACR2O6_13610, partial [Ilumatobacteraceae bacterium]